jgi:hypothetical protein
MVLMSLNNKASEAKYNVKLSLDGSIGVIENNNSEEIPCHVETQLRIEISGVGPTNEIQIYGRIRSSNLWHYIATVTGPVTGIADISTYDFIRYFQTVADATGELVASGFIFSNTNSSKLNTIYTYKYDTSVDGFVYVGEAEVGTIDSDSSWRISRIDSSTTVITILYASFGYFNQIWDDRLSLIYE